MSRRLRLAAAARADIDGILRASATVFGATARARYGALISTGLADLRADPLRTGARARPEIGEGLRTYHLSHCRRRAAAGGRRVGAPRHLRLYRIEPDGAVAVLRVLHDAMELAGHLPRDEA